MRRVSSILILIVLAQVGIFARFGSLASTQGCPDISVKCPALFGNSKEPVTITAFVSGGDSNVKPLFTWSFSGGKIINGQGTSTITVDELEGGANYTATIKIGRFPESCADTASCTFMREWPPPAHKFDEYGKIEAEDEMARLDYLAIELNNMPDDMGYLIAYAGRRARVKEASARLERAKDYLVNTRGISEDRIVIIDGGNREEFIVEVYIVSAGSNPPVASPTVSPDKVQIIKSASRKKRRRTSGH